ncbi:MAG: secreted protein [Marmoricola sp.]|nr:secreted protein [Marmoricola sp.]
MPPPAVTAYSERLHVPLRWWVQATMLLASLWLAFIVAMPAWAAWSSTGVLLLATFGLFAWVGSSRVAVRDGVLYAGRAHIPVALIGPVEALDAEQTRRVHGVEADARAFLLTRPYLKRSVKVTIDDPADRTPYWLVSTRHPRRLAAALMDLRDSD